MKNIWYWIFPIGQIKQYINDKLDKDYDDLVYTENYKNISAEKKELLYSLIQMMQDKLFSHQY